MQLIATTFATYSYQLCISLTDVLYYLGCSMEQAKLQGIGRQIISKFLNWNGSFLSSTRKKLRRSRPRAQPLELLNENLQSRLQMPLKRYSREANLLSLFLGKAWTALPRVIDETVRVTKQFLEDHPEEKKKILVHGKDRFRGS